MWENILYVVNISPIKLSTLPTVLGCSGHACNLAHTICLAGLILRCFRKKDPEAAVGEADVTGILLLGPADDGLLPPSLTAREEECV